MIKLVIFDLDGLLINSEKTMWLPNMSQTLKEMGYDESPDFLRTLMGGARKTSEAKLLERFGKDFDVDYFYKRHYELNNYQVDNGLIPLCDGALTLLNYLKDNKISFCVGTSSPPEYVHRVLKKCGIFEYFDHIITRADVTTPKPAPDIYNKCASLYSYNKDEMLVLEDAHFGALSAKAAGIRCILIPNIAILEESDRKEFTLLNNLLEVIDLIQKENICTK